MFLKLALIFAITCGWLAAANVLIVADEIPAMEVLAKELKARVAVDSTIVKQDALPADLSRYADVIVYIHQSLDEPAEKAFIQYAQQGGRLILLHHSISSGKRKNKEWFPFLKIELPDNAYADGGYKYFDPADFDVINLAPNHYITSNKVTYSEKVNGSEAFRVTGTEIYLNHVFTGPRTTLLGIRYVDKATGKTYQQLSAGWYRPAAKGMVMYFMVGHNTSDFENPVYAQILANAVSFRP